MLILENRKLAELKRTAGMQLHVPAGERERERGVRLDIYYLFEIPIMIYCP
jgi:hypothetical protein